MCVLSPDLFSLCSEMMNEIEDTPGIKVGEYNIKNLRTHKKKISTICARQMTVLIDENVNDMNNLLDIILEVIERAKSNFLETRENRKRESLYQRAR